MSDPIRDPLTGQPVAPNRGVTGGYSFAGNVWRSFLLDTIPGQTVQRVQSNWDAGELLTPFPNTPDYNAARDPLVRASGMDPSRFFESRSAEESRFIIDQAKRNETLRTELERADAGASRFLGGLFEVDTLIPIPLGKGVGFVRGAARGGAALMGTTALTQGYLQALDPDRPVEEFAGAVAGAGLFGAALGGLAGRFGRERLAFDADTIVDDLDRAGIQNERGLASRSMDPADPFAQRPWTEADQLSQDRIRPPSRTSRREGFEVVRDTLHSDIDGAVHFGDLDVGQAHRAHAIVDLLPDHWLDKLRVRTDQQPEGASLYGQYFPIRDVVEVFFKPYAPKGFEAGEVIAHEIGHRVLARFATDEEIAELQVIWRSAVDDLAKKAEAEGTTALKAIEEGGYDRAAYRMDFHEWFANTIQARYARRLEEGGDAGRHPVKAIVDRVVSRVREFLAALGARFGWGRQDHAAALERLIGRLERRTKQAVRQGEVGTRHDRLEGATEQFLIDVVVRQEQIMLEEARKLIDDIRTEQASLDGDLPFAKPLEAHLAKRQEQFAKGEEPEPWRLAPTGIGIEKIRTTQLPYFLMKNNRLPGILASLFGELSDAVGGSPGLMTRGVLNGSRQMQQSVATAAKQWWVRYKTVRTAMDEAYAEYRGFQGGMNAAGATIRQAADWAGQKGIIADQLQGKMTYPDFRREVGRALLLGEHDNPAVMKAAQAMERDLYRPMGEAAQETGVIGPLQMKKEAARAAKKVEDLAGRLEDWQEILTRREAEGARVSTLNKIDAIVKERTAKLDEARAELNRLEEAITKAEEKGLMPGEKDASFLPRRWLHDVVAKHRSALVSLIVEKWKAEQPTADWGALQKRANAAVDNILGINQKPAADRREPGGYRPASAMARDIGIDSRDLIGVKLGSERVDFIELDADALARHYLNTMAPSIEMARRFGDLNLKGLAEGLDGHMDQLRMAVVGDNGMLEALEKEYALQMEALSNLRDVTLGVYGEIKDPSAWDLRTVNLAKNWATLSLMGQTWKTALTDTGSVILATGLRPFVEGVVQTMTMKGQANPLSFGRAERELAGAVAETLTHQRLNSMIDASIGARGYSKAERLIDGAVDKMFLLNLLNPWTDFIKDFAGGVIQSNIIRHSIAWSKGTVSESGRRSLLAAGIDEGYARAIAEAWERAGAQRSGALYLANTGAWAPEDAAALRVFRSALMQDIERAVVTPGASDRPLFVSKPMGSLVFQYKGFAMSSTMRIGMRAMQQRDQEALSGVLALVGAGYVVDFFKSSDTDRRPLYDPARLLRAVEVSGVAGIFADVNAMAETVSGGAVGIRPALGIKPEYFNRDPNWAQRAGAALGPAASIFGEAIWAMTAEDAQTDDRGRAIKRLMPFNNLWFWNDFLNRGTRDVTDALEE